MPNQFANDIQVDTFHDEPRSESVSQVMPVEVFNLGFLEIPLSIRVLDSVLEALSTVAAIKNVGIMEHPRKALQGLNDHFVHGDVSSLAGLAFADRDSLWIPAEWNFQGGQYYLFVKK
ncbi:MAG TPA: hypothetical protein VFS12_13530 [Terriglobia bacterium]|nr:hypothetical protein [Terriglobia bacterium]